jgi:hypothetical protein
MSVKSRPSRSQKKKAGENNINHVTATVIGGASYLGTPKASVDFVIGKSFFYYY